MVKLSKGLIFLLIANIATGIATGFIESEEKPEKWKEKISSLKKELPGLKQKYEWVQKSRSLIENAPSAMPNKVLGDWRQLGERLGVEFTETENTGGIPARLSFKGNSEYNKLALLLNRIASEKAAVIKQLSLELREETIWEFAFTVDVRNGDWKTAGYQQQKPEIIEKYENIPYLGTKQLFRTKKPVAIAKPIIRERIVYNGYFDGKKGPILILEINGKSFVRSVGERTPGGVLITKADINRIVLVGKSSAGKEMKWVVKMQK